MEWREQTSVTCEDAFTEAQRWMEEVTNKSFGSNNFRSALENGVLLCHLINQLKPGVIKRMNILSTPMAGLDNVNVFLRACGTLGLHEAQLFHPGDLQDLSTRATLRCVEGKRRLKNVLITIYWLGRKALADPLYSGPQLNLKSFEGLLGIALSKALEETPRGSVKDGDVSYPEQDDELLPLTQSQPPGYSREDSVESFKSVLSFDSAESPRTLSYISDSILRAGSEDSSSEVEAESCFRMKAAEGRDSGQRNWGSVPAPFQRKKWVEKPIKGCIPSPLTSLAPPPLSPPLPQLPDVEAFLQWAYHSDSDSDADRPQPDVVADDLASRRFRSPSPATPTNFAVPMSPQGTLRLWTGSPRLFRIDTPSRHTAVFSPSSSTAASPFPPNSFHDPPSSITPTFLSEVERSVDEELLMALCEEDSEEGREDPDPVKDDLYARWVELALHQTSSNPGYNRFLPRYWTPEEEVHVRTIRLGSQRRPWYRKMYRFRSKSLNDIRRYPSATQVVRQVSEGGFEELSPSAVSQDQLQTVRARVHESEAKWHNDLTKWKLRRHRSNCDLRRKMQERDNAGVGTCRSLQEDREEDEESLCSSSYNEVSPSTSVMEGSLELRAHTRDPASVKEGSLELRAQTRASTSVKEGSLELRAPTSVKEGSLELRAHTSVKEGSLELRAQTRAPTSVKEGSLELRAPTRAPLALSSSVESPYSAGASEPFTTPSLTLQAQGPSAGAVPQSEPLVLGERRRHTPVEPDGAGGLATFPDSASPFSSQTRAQSISSPALVVSTGRDQIISSPALVVSTGRDQIISSPALVVSTGRDQISTTLTGSGSNLTSGTSSSHSLSASMDIPGQALLSTVQSLTSVAPAPGHVSAPQRQELHLYRYSSRAPGGRGGTGVSASLPRGYCRSEGSSSCLSAGFTPRPFGAKSSRVSSLPRLYNLENSLQNGNGSLTSTKTRPQKMVTISEVAVAAQPWATANRSGVNQEVNEESGNQTQLSILKTRGGPGPATCPKPSLKGPFAPSLLPSLPVPVSGRQNASAQVRHGDRVSLTLKLTSRPHFGFNTHWDSTGARVGGIQPGSPADLCQLRAGDEIVSVGGHRVAEMSHGQWKGTMTSALQKGSLTMDVQRYGNNSPTDTSRETTMVKLAQLNGQEGVTSKSTKGGFRDDPLAIRSKEHDLIVLKTQKRRAEFFNQKASPGVSSMVYLCGGSASAISDLQVPSLSTSSSSWSWDPEEERRRQEKWQEEQERLLQEKYREDQERLDAEWQQAQEEAGYRQAEVTPDPLPSRGIVGNVVPCVDSSAPNTESAGEMTNGIASLASPQPVLSQPMPPVAHVASNQKKEVVFDGGRREEPHPQEGRSLEEETGGLAEGDTWSGDSYGFTQLSIADRMKSKSFPSLEGFHRQEVKGVTGEVARRKSRQSMSLVEAERQQILEEMRKRTALLTDNSWIRQRSTSDNKQPNYRRGPMRRYDSLDNLSSSSSLLSNPQRPHSSLGFSAPYCPPSSRHSMGGALGGYSNGTQKHSPTKPRPFSASSTPPNTGEEPATGESRPVSQQHDRVLTSRQVCSVCVCPMGRGAAMVIETLNLCFHLACFQCVDCRCRLGGSEVRAQIRISNGKPYCDPCYIRLKSHLATSQ